MYSNTGIKHIRAKPSVLSQNPSQSLAGVSTHGAYILSSCNILVANSYSRSHLVPIVVSKISYSRSHLGLMLCMLRASKILTTVACSFVFAVWGAIKPASLCEIYLLVASTSIKMA